MTWDAGVVPRMGVTRTPGYWMTHYVESNRLWNEVVADGNALQCGSPDNFVVDTTAKLEGGFWSRISFESQNKVRRSSDDQARMQLSFQLLAAILNNQAFGSDPGATILSDARTNFCGTDREAMLSSAGLLDTFNNEGTDLPFPDWYVNGPANPRLSRFTADKMYWDQPTLPR